MEQERIDTINEQLALTFEKQSHHAAIYNAIYHLFYEGDFNLCLNVGGITFRLWEPDRESCSVWEMGIEANNEVYTVGGLYDKNLGPGNYAQLFAGTYDIIDGLADLICEDFNL